MVPSEIFFIEDAAFWQMSAIESTHVFIDQIVFAYEVSVIDVGVAQIGHERWLSFVSL